VSLLARLAAGSLLTAFLVFSLAPFLWMVAASLKPGDEQLIFGNPWWAASPDWSNYTKLLVSPLFLRWAGNTALVLLGTLAISLGASILAAYALAHRRVPQARLLVVALFATYLLPSGLLWLPMIKVVQALGLVDSPLALVVTYPGLIIPFATWVLWNFFKDLPPDLVEQARLEGAGDLRILARVLLPVALPVLAAVALFGIAITFNDYLYGLAFLSAPGAQTLISEVAHTSVDINDAGFTFAAILLGVAPVAVSCAFFADTYAKGLGTGVID